MHLTLVFPRLKTFSGAEHLLLQLSRFAVEQGHEVTVVTRRVDPVCEGLFDERVEVRVPPVPFRWLSGNHLVDSFFDTAFALSLAPGIPRGSDVVCFLCPPVLPAMAWFRRRSQAPVAYYCLQPPRFAYDLMQETVAANGIMGLFVPLVAGPYRWLDRRLAPKCDRLFAISEDYARWCRDLYRPARLDIVYPGIDLEPAASADPDRARRALDVDARTPLVVTTNKLIARKNIDVFLRAMQTVVERFPEARAAVVGDGPLREPLLSLRDELGLRDKVFFTGFVPDQREVMGYYAAADVYVFLEKNVPFGLTILEAGACGRPTIGVRGGGTRDTMVEDQTGFLVAGDVLDPREVAEKVCILLDSRDLRERMGAKGLENARRFSFEATSARFLAILESMVEERA